MNAPQPAGRERSRRWTGATAAAGLTGLLSLAGAPAAFAADDDLQFSLDGTTFSSTIAGPVFQDGYLYIPGAAAGTTLWVRNNSSEPAALTSAAVIVRSDAELNNYMGLRAGAESNLSSRTQLGSTGSCADVNQAWELNPGEALELDFQVDLSWDAPNETRNRTAEFDLLFLLQSESGGMEPRPACAAAAGGQAPSTPNESYPGAPVGAEQPRRPDASLSVVPGNRPVSGAGQAPVIQAAGALADTGAGRSINMIAPLETPVALVPAGFQSTVEPIIRSLSGTLLIGMSVLFTAAVILRLRNRSANE